MITDEQLNVPASIDNIQTVLPDLITDEQFQDAETFLPDLITDEQFQNAETFEEDKIDLKSYIKAYDPTFKELEDPVLPSIPYIETSFKSDTPLALPELTTQYAIKAITKRTIEQGDNDSLIPPIYVKRKKTLEILTSMVQSYKTDYRISYSATNVGDYTSAHIDITDIEAGLTELEKLAIGPSYFKPVFYYRINHYARMLILKSLTKRHHLNLQLVKEYTLRNSTSKPINPIIQSCFESGSAIDLFNQTFTKVVVNKKTLTYSINQPIEDIRSEQGNWRVYTPPFYLRTEMSEMFTDSTKHPSQYLTFHYEYDTLKPDDSVSIYYVHCSHVFSAIEQFRYDYSNKIYNKRLNLTKDPLTGTIDDIDKISLLISTLKNAHWDFVMLARACILKIAITLHHKYKLNTS